MNKILGEVESEKGLNLKFQTVRQPTNLFCLSPKMLKSWVSSQDKNIDFWLLWSVWLSGEPGTWVDASCGWSSSQLTVVPTVSLHLNAVCTCCGNVSVCHPGVRRDGCTLSPPSPGNTTATARILRPTVNVCDQGRKWTVGGWMGSSQAVSGRLSEGRPLSPGAYLSPSGENVPWRGFRERGEQLE